MMHKINTILLCRHLGCHNDPVLRYIYKKGPETIGNGQDKQDSPKDQDQGPPISCLEEGRPRGGLFGLGRPPGSFDPLLGSIGLVHTRSLWK